MSTSTQWIDASQSLLTASSTCGRRPRKSCSVLTRRRPALWTGRTVLTAPREGPDPGWKVPHVMGPVYRAARVASDSQCWLLYPCVGALYVLVQPSNTSSCPTRLCRVFISGSRFPANSTGSPNEGDKSLACSRVVSELLLVPHVMVPCSWCEIAHTVYDECDARQGLRRQCPATPFHYLSKVVRRRHQPKSSLLGYSVTCAHTEQLRMFAACSCRE